MTHPNPLRIMHFIRSRPLVCVFFAGLMALCCGGGDEEHPTLRMGETSVWMSVAQNQTADLALVFFNDGDATLEITEITVTPSWVTVSPATILVRPGGQGSVTLTASPGSASAGIHQGRILVASNDPARSLLSVPLEIRVVEGLPPSVTVTPTLYVLGLSSGDSTTVTCTVTNSGSSVAQVTQVSAQCSWVTAAPSSLSLDPGGSAEIFLTVRSLGLSEGRHQCTVQMFTTDPNAPRYDVVIDLTVGVSGGASRIVVAEEFTGTWCQYCPGAMMGLHALQGIVGADRLAVVVYHLQDSFTILAGQDRARFYDVSPIPHVIFDGTVSRIGGSNTTPVDYTAQYNQRASIPSPLTIGLSLEAYDLNTGSGTLRAACRNVTRGEIDARLLVVMTGVDSLYSWQGFDHLYNTAIGVPFGSGGVMLALAPEASDTIVTSFSTPAGWLNRPREMVCFAQSFESKEIHQGAILRLP